MDPTRLLTPAHPSCTDTASSCATGAAGTPPAWPPGEVSVGTFCGIGADGRFLVCGEGNGLVQPALSAIALQMSDIGCQVVLARLAETGAPHVVILARVCRAGSAHAAELKIDGERLVLRADQGIELRCGSASIVLTQAGKVLIQGDYVLSRSRGANRIKGACVDIN